jgi:NAD(P)-dependent dehydrogenase (short-subunit alcohol dehydrogenase family)
MTDAKTILITGAADGIGWAMAQLYSSRGYQVALADLDGAKARERAAELGPAHLGLTADVASESDVTAMAAAVEAHFGFCEAVINNAGIGDTHLPTVEQDVGHFRKILEVHLAGTFLVSREMGRRMLEQGRGAIINISSIAGLGGLPRRNGYGAAKAGIVAMTRSLASEWGPKGVRVNALAPGYVETALVRKLVDAGRIDLDKLRRRIPMGQLGQPEDIAEAAFFLTSPAARYITGAVLSVDGGWQAFSDAGDAYSP